MPHDKMKIAIIDYQMSNIFSVQHACQHVGLEAVITSDGKEVGSSDAVILPGVGAFGEAMDNLKRLDLIGPIKDSVASGKPFLGICLGLQLLMEESDEFGLNQGLGIIKGRVIRFPSRLDDKKDIKVPQIGWNRIMTPADSRETWDRSPLKGVLNNEFMYFVHSFYIDPSEEGDILSMTDYEGVRYCSSVLKGNVAAFQFHPEKSGVEGIKIYRNWAENIKKVLGEIDAGK